MLCMQHARDMIKSAQENGWASGWDAKPLKTVGHILQTQVRLNSPISLAS